jgi:hypothetical protein
MVRSKKDWTEEKLDRYTKVLNDKIDAGEIDIDAGEIDIDQIDMDSLNKFKKRLNEVLDLLGCARSKL